MSDRLKQVAIRLVEQPPLYSETPMDGPEAAVRVMHDLLADMDREVFCIVNLQSDLRPINMNIVSVGALDHTIAHPREIFKSAILSNASRILLAHNHPSGVLTPSNEDIQTTARIQEAGELMGIPLVDHIIVAKGQEYYSFKEKDVLPLPGASLVRKLDELYFAGDKTEEEKEYPLLREGEGKGAEKAGTATIPLPVSGKDMKSILASLEEGVKGIFTGERYAEFLKTMSRFHRYSFQNTLLIAMQRPDATLVAGYRKWQSMGRQVRRGEKGITIVAPAPVKRKREQDVSVQNESPVPDGEGKEEEAETVIPRFKAATVFDIGQTEGRPVETLEPEELTDAVKDHDLFLKAIRELSPVPIRMDEIEGQAKGFYDTGAREIVVQKGMSESQTIKTAVHETCHAMLHDRETMEKEGVQKDQMTREIEAESVAYCVCSAFRIDTSGYSFPYIAGWSSGRDMKELKASMDTIRETAGKLIDGLSEKLRLFLAEEKQQAMEEDRDQGLFLLEDIGRTLEAAKENNRYVKDSLKQLGIRQEGKPKEVPGVRPEQKRKEHKTEKAIGR